MSARPSFRPRPLGGFNPGMGHLNEHLDEDAFQSNVTQKMLGQQATSSAQQTTGGSALGSSQNGSAGVGNPFTQPQTPQIKPREVGSIQEELIQRPVQDIFTELKGFFDVNKLLGIDSAKDDPQTQARKKQMLQRWNNLNSEQQEVAKQRYQAEMKKKQQLEQEKQQKEQQKQQQSASSIEVPSSPKKGPVGPAGSKKQKVVQKLQNDRKTLSGPASAN
jgi:hypothetical protein